MIWSIILTALALIVAKFIYSYILRPYLLVLYYRRQGCYMYFKPGMGIAGFEEEFSQTHNDSLHFSKRVVSKNLKWRAWGGNLGPDVMIHLFDTKLIKAHDAIQDTAYIKVPHILGIIAKSGGENGIIFQEGKEWKRHRKIVSKAFHFEFLRGMMPVMVAAAQEKFD